MIPEIPKKLKLGQPDLTKQVIKDMNLEHFLPPQNIREKLVKNSDRKDLIFKMHSFNNDSMYGDRKSSPTIK
jgi:hypothetical protein